MINAYFRTCFADGAFVFLSTDDVSPLPVEDFEVAPVTLVTLVALVTPVSTVTPVALVAPLGSSNFFLSCSAKSL